MLPALTIHLKPMSPSLSARLQTTFALLLPCLWWAPPSWVIPSPPPPLSLWAANLSRATTRLLLILFKVVMVCLSHLILALWLGPVKSASQSDKHTPALICLCCVNTVTRRLWRRHDPFLRFVFSAGTKLCVPSASVMPLKDIIAGVRLRCF